MLMETKRKFKFGLFVRRLWVLRSYIVLLLTECIKKKRCWGGWDIEMKGNIVCGRKRMKLIYALWLCK